MDKMKINQFHTTDVKELSINGTTVTATAADINALPCGSVASMTTATTPASGTCAVQLVFADAASVTMAIPTAGLLYISEVDTGLTNDPVAGLAVLTNGALDELVTGGTSIYTTTAAGLLGVTITHAGADSFWIVVILPNGKLLISDECVVNA